MPSPEQMRGYKDGFPDFAQAIHDEFRANGEHNRAMEKLRLEAQIEDQSTVRDIQSKGQTHNLVATLGVLLFAAAMTAFASVAAGGTIAGIWLVLWILRAVIDFLQNRPTS